MSNACIKLPITKNGAGKLSGAGAGDCGIALTFNPEAAQKIEKEWRKNGILPIKIKIAFKGIKIEK